MKKIISFFALALCCLNTLFAQVNPNGTISYVRDALPWSQDQLSILNQAFGAGNYNVSTYASAASLFNNNVSFIYLEGSDATNPASLNTFLNANRTTVENWVSAGGKLFLNAAPNQGSNINFGFGGITLTYPAASSTASIASGQTSHTIFNGPQLPVGTSWTGGSFSHAAVSGGGITPLLTGTAGTILGEKVFGSGRVMFGGMTTTNFHSPLTNAINLRVNILKYLKGSAVVAPPVATITAGGPTTFCSPGSVVLTAGIATSYQWRLNGSVINGATARTFTASQSGSYTVTVTNSVGTAVTSSATVVTVNPLPAATASNNGAVISGGTISLSASGGTTYSWTGPNSFSSALQNPSIPNATTAKAGTYTVTVTSNGCTANASTTAVVNTVSATALNFDGIDDYISAPESASLNNLGKTGLSMEAWVNSSNVNSVNSIIRKNGDYDMYIAGGKLHAEIWPHGSDDDVWLLFDGTTTLSSNTWYHVSCTWDGVNATLFVNGVKEAITQAAGTVGDYETLYIGKSRIYDQPFFGSMDEVRIWDRALCQGEIQNNMSKEVAPQSGLVAYYKLNQGLIRENNVAINQAHDEISNTDNGTLVNFALSGATSNWSAGTVTGIAPAFVPPTATITTNGATTFCPSGSVALTANSGTGLTYQWTKDGIAINGQTAATFTANASGSYSVIVTNNGCTAIAAPVAVVVEDVAAPVITSVQADITVALSANGTALLANYTYGATAADNCTAAASIVFTQSPAAGTPLLQNVPVTVTLTATDASGNFSTQTFTVTATDQTVPTVLTRNTTIQLDAGGNAVLSPAQIDNGSSDNVGITSLTLDKTNFNCADVTASPTDYKEFFTFVSDNTWRQSTVVTPSNEGSAFWNGVSNVPAASTYTIVPTIGSYSVTKIAGTQGILVNGDVTFLRKTINISNASNLRVTLLASVDNDVQLFVNSTEVALEGDLAGENFADAFHSRVILNENTPNVNGGTGFQAFDRITNIKASTLFHTGDNDVVFAVRNTGGGDRGEVSFKVIFEKAGSGVPVTLTATDQAGNSTSALAYVTVEDKIAPVAPVLADVTGQCAVTVIAATATDNCSGIVTGTTASPLTYTAQGTYTINWKFTDASGNFSTTTQTVIVKDVTAPVFTSVQNNVIVALNASGTASLAAYASTATDNCTAPASIVFTQSPAVGTPLVMNVPTTVTLTATDAVGNFTTQSFTVTAKDQTAPIVKTKNITVALNASGSATIAPAQVDNGTTDNSGNFTLSLDKTTFDCSNLGPNPVTLTAIDGSGNTSASVIPAGMIGLWDFEDATKLKDQTGNWGDLIVTGNAAIAGGSLDANSGMARTSSYTGAVIRSKTLISYVSLDNLSQGAGSAMTIDRINSDSFDGLIYAESQPTRWMNGSSNGLRNQNFVPGFAETAPNQLVQIAITYEEKPSNQVLISFYRNGVAYGSYTSGNFATWSAGDAEIIFGARHYYNPNNQQIGSLAAHIHKAMLFNRALTQQEIQSLNGPATNAVVTVIDTIGPVIVSKPVSVTLTASGTVSIIPSDVLVSGTDNCSPVTYTLSKSTFGAADAIASPVTIQLIGKDASGNQTSVPVLVTVIDPVPVVITRNITVALDASGNASITAAQIDNGSSSVVGLSGLSLSKTAFNCADLGENTVTLTATSTLGSTASATAIVTVEDKIAPIRPVLADVVGECAATAVAPTTTDNCAGVVTGTTSDYVTYTAQGTYLITWTFDDGHGNITTATQQVIVKDVTAPVFAAVAAISVRTDAGVCGAKVMYETPVATDNCSATTVQTAGLPSGSVFPVGTTINTFLATDIAGNTDSISFTVTVTDNEKPKFAAISDKFTTNDAGICGAKVVYVTPEATDNCTVATVQTAGLPSGSIFPVGTTINTFIATDASGNRDSISFTVTVKDIEKPKFAAIANRLVNSQPGICGSQVLYLTPKATDNCSATTIQAAGLPSGSVFPVGITINKFLAIDASGNRDSISFTVTIRDLEKPRFAAIGNRTLNSQPGVCGSQVLYLTPKATDNCSATTIQTAGLPSGSVFPVGTTINKFLAIDASGNRDSISFTITIIDIEKPKFALAPNIAVNNDVNVCGAKVVYTAPKATDNCTVNTIQTAGLPSGSVFPIGTTINKFLAIDASGNRDSISFTVKVTDNQAPAFAAISDISVNTDLNVCGAKVVYTTPNATDNCAVSTVQTAGLPSGSVFPTGTTVNSFKATDASGNVSEISFTVTVTDNQAPAFAAIANIAVSTDLNVCGAKVVYSTPNATDNCAVSTVQTAGLPSGSVFPTGTTVNTFKASDASGNVSTISFTVTVTDKEAPKALAKNVIVQLNESGQGTVTAELVNNESSDACGIRSIALSKTTFDCSNVGANSVTLTVIDNNGNVSTVTATVTVEDKIAPGIAQIPYQEICFTASNAYSLPALTATDNCAVKTISYVMSGATVRSGASNNASGMLNTGLTTITWTVTDASGNVSTSKNDVRIWALPVASITASSVNDFCNEVSLTPASTVTAASYRWVYNNATFSTSAVLKLDVADNDGVYKLYITDIHGCTNTNVASYTFAKQATASSYTVLGIRSVKLAENNKVLSGSVGAMGTKGKVEIKKNSSVAALGAFVKAASINIQSPSNVPARISAPVVVTLPAMQYFSGNVNSLPKYTASTNNAVLTGNYRELLIKKGITVTLSGTLYGDLTIEEGAKVTFTAPVINIDELDVQGSSKAAFTTVMFSGAATVKVSDKVEIEDRSTINPDGQRVTFYVGSIKEHKDKYKTHDRDDNCSNRRGGDDGHWGDDDGDNDDDYYGKGSFDVNGDGSSVTANVYVPYGKIKVNGGDKAATTMTGQFIAEDIQSEGKGVTWNSTSCSGSVPVAQLMDVRSSDTLADVPVVGTLNISKPQLTVYPNPFAFKTTVSYTLIEDEAKVSLDLYSLTGVKVRSVYSGPATAFKTESFSFESLNLPAGTYFFRLIGSKANLTFKVIIAN